MEFEKELLEINEKSLNLQINIQKYLSELENHKEEPNEISYAQMEEEFANYD